MRKLFGLILALALSLPVWLQAQPKPTPSPIPQTIGTTGNNTRPMLGGVLAR